VEDLFHRARIIRGKRQLGIVRRWKVERSVDARSELGFDLALDMIVGIHLLVDCCLVERPGKHDELEPDVGHGISLEESRRDGKPCLALDVAREVTRVRRNEMVEKIEILDGGHEMNRKYS